MFKEMKIEINEQQPLEEVVVELERLGYKKDLTHGKVWVLCHELGLYSIHSHDYDFGNLTTLTELRSMNIEALKEMRDEFSGILL
jgi:hypothetical protein